MELAPDLANPVHPVVLLPHPADVLAKLRVATGTCRQPAAVRFLGLARVVARRAIGNCLQIGSTPYSSRCASMNDVMSWVGGRAPSRCPAGDCCAITERRGEIRRCLAQDLVRTTKLQVLPFQRLEPLTLLAREPWSNAGIALRATHPLAKRLRRAANLRRHRDDGRPLRVVLALVVQNQPHCPFSELRGVSV